MIQTKKISTLRKKAKRTGWGQKYIDEMLSGAITVDYEKGTYTRKSDLKKAIEDKWRKTHPVKDGSSYEQVKREIYKFGNKAWIRELERLQMWIKNRTASGGCIASDAKIKQAKKDFENKWRAYLNNIENK